jgi:hypothetical protein
MTRRILIEIPGGEEEREAFLELLDDSDVDYCQPEPAPNMDVRVSTALRGPDLPFPRAKRVLTARLRFLACVSYGIVRDYPLNSDEGLADSFIGELRQIATDPDPRIRRAMYHCFDHLHVAFGVLFPCTHEEAALLARLCRACIVATAYSSPTEKRMQAINRASGILKKIAEKGY